MAQARTIDTKLYLHVRPQFGIEPGLCGEVVSAVALAIHAIQLATQATMPDLIKHGLLKSCKDVTCMTALQM